MRFGYGNETGKAVLFGYGRQHHCMNDEDFGAGYGRRFAHRKNPDGNGGHGRNLGGGYGTGGFCVCAKCGEKLPHQRGIKCTTVKCPNCGHTMVREELLTKKKEN